MISVDRRGWFYTGSEAGAFVNMHGGRNACTNGSWQVYYDVRREWRRYKGFDIILDPFSPFFPPFFGGDEIVPRTQRL